MGHVVGVLHGIALLESGPCRIGVEVGDEFTAAIPRPDVLGFGVEKQLPPARELLELLVIGLMAQLAGHLCDGIGAERVFERMRCRESRAVGRGLHAQFGQVGRIALTDEFSHVQFARAGRAAFAAQLVLAGGLVAQRHVEVADAAVVGRGNGEPREVGAYARDVLAACDAVAEPSGVLVDQQLARHPVGIVFGIGDAPQLREVPVGAPDRIGIVIVVFRLASAVERNLPDRAVVGGVGPVHVAGQAAPQQGVEQPRVELHAVIVQAALDAKPA